MECCFFIGWQGYEFVEHPVLLKENHMEWCSNLWPASGKLDRAPPFFLHVNIMVCQSSIWMRWQWWSSTILQHPFPSGLKRPSSGTAQKMNWLFGTQWELCEHAIKVALFELPLLFFCSLLWRWEHYQSRFLCHRYFYLGCCPKAAFTVNGQKLAFWGNESSDLFQMSTFRWLFSGITSNVDVGNWSDGSHSGKHIWQSSWLALSSVAFSRELQCEDFFKFLRTTSFSHSEYLESLLLGSLCIFCRIIRKAVIVGQVLDQRFRLFFTIKWFCGFFFFT